MEQQLCTMLSCQARVVEAFWGKVALHHIVTQGILTAPELQWTKKLLNHASTVYSFPSLYINTLRTLFPWPSRTHSDQLNNGG